MSRRHKVHFPNDLYFVTLTIVGWIDIFTRRDYCDIIIENLKYCKEHKGLTIYAYVIMSNHMHMICLLYTSPSPRDATLSRMPSSA